MADLKTNIKNEREDDEIGPMGKGDFDYLLVLMHWTHGHH
jgi:hypothetical protein